MIRLSTRNLRRRGPELALCLSLTLLLAALVFRLTGARLWSLRAVIAAVLIVLLTTIRSLSLTLRGKGGESVEGVHPGRAYAAGCWKHNPMPTAAVEDRWPDATAQRNTERQLPPIRPPTSRDVAPSAVRRRRRVGERGRKCATADRAEQTHAGRRHSIFWPTPETRGPSSILLDSGDSACSSLQAPFSSFR